LRSVRSRLPRIGFVDVFGALLAVFGRFNGHFGAFTMARKSAILGDFGPNFHVLPSAGAVGGVNG
jgi:hypothetical protein